MARRPRSPQEKKRLALERDRVDSWGESQKAARKNLPLIRARIERAFRRRVKQELSRGDAAQPEKIRRKRWRKWPGPTLATQVEKQLGRRARLEREPRKSEEARLRRATRRRRQRG